MLFIHFSLKAQNPEPPFLFALNAWNEGGYFKAVSDLEQAHNSYTERPEYRQQYWQALSTYYSFIGEDHQALVAYDRAFHSSEPEEPDRPADSVLIPPGLEFEDAIEYIVKAARDERIVIINEAHMVPQHRVLTTEVMLKLSQQGFQYFGLEGLSVQDSMLKERKYPEQSSSGFYLSEPIYGKMVRAAMAAGFHLFGYDDAPPCNYNKDKPNYCNNLRELYQAMEIGKVLLNNPDARVLIHCGLDHLFETSSTDWIRMAEYLKILTGIDPLTVNQAKYIERGDERLETDIYHAISKGHSGMRPFIFTSNGEAWVPDKYKGFYDIQVFWPRITFIQGRPSYLTIQSACRKYIIPPDKLDTGLVVQAFLQGESDRAVPMDQFIIKDQIAASALYLPPGKYVIKFKDNDDHLVDSYEVEVK